MRFSIRRRTGAPSQPVRSRKRRSATAARFAPSTPGQMHAVGRRPRPAGSSSTSSASAIGWKTLTSSWRPSVARRADVEAEVDLRRRRVRAARSRGHRSASASARNSSGARRSARTSAGWPSACERRAGAVAHVGPVARGQRERARQRLAAVGEGGPDERAQRGRRRRAGAVEDDEHRVDVGHRVEDRARDRAVHAHVAGELGEHARDAVGRRCPARRRSARRPRAGPSPPSA